MHHPSDRLLDFLPQFNNFHWFVIHRLFLWNYYSLTAQNYPHSPIFPNYGLTRTAESFSISPTLRNFVIGNDVVAYWRQFQIFVIHWHCRIECWKFFISLCASPSEMCAEQRHRAYQRFRLLIKLRHFGSLSADSDNACVHRYWYMVSYPISGHEHCCLFIRKVV